MPRLFSPLGRSGNPAERTASDGESARRAARTLPSRGGLPPPAVRAGPARSAAVGAEARRPEAAGEALPSRGWTPAAWPRCTELVSLGFSGWIGFAGIGCINSPAGLAADGRDSGLMGTRRQHARTAFQPRH